MNKKYILIFISITAVITIGFIVYNFSTSNPETTQDNVKNILISNESLVEKTYTNELTGEVLKSETEPEFMKNRPLAVMVNNALPARPQAGLNEADLIYEIIAEGGITRFLVFYYSAMPEVVGPIRSTREYYLQIVKETGDSMLMHIGFSPQAREKIDTWRIKSLGLNGGTFYRNNFGNSEIATEHTAFADGNTLHRQGLSIWDGKDLIESWKYKDSKKSLEGMKKGEYIEINFWYKGDYSGIFKYNSQNNRYTRYSGFDEKNEPVLLVDRVTKRNIEVSNVVVMFAEEFPIPNDDKNRLDYKLIGSGKALVFNDGMYQEATWKKDSLKERTKFYLVNGSEVEFNRGKTWVSIVPSRNESQVLIK